MLMVTKTKVRDRMEEESEAKANTEAPRHTAGGSDTAAHQSCKHTGDVTNTSHHGPIKGKPPSSSPPQPLSTNISAPSIHNSNNTSIAVQFM